MNERDNNQSSREKNESANQCIKDLYGLEPEMSLQSVNFAPNENTLLTGQGEGEENKCE
jgi:hypothetical protein